MRIRGARIEDAKEACRILKRSITELCQLDHQGDPHILELWLANKTVENLRRWITESCVLVATDGGAIAGVGALDGSGQIITRMPDRPP
jgi:hypothetical protein